MIVLNNKPSAFLGMTGAYGCLVNNNVYLEHPVDIKYVPELISNSLQNTSEVGSEVIFKCSVRSRSTPDLVSNITWTLNGTALTCDSDGQECQIATVIDQASTTVNFKTSTLTVTNVQENNTGNYQCTVVSNAGLEDFESAAQLFLKVTEDIPMIFKIDVTSSHAVEKVSPKEFLVLQDTEVNLDCSHNGSSLTWELPDFQTVQDNPLSIFRVDSDGDQGTYICTSVNSLGNVVQDSVSLIIVEHIRIVEHPMEDLIELDPGQELRLVCEAIVDSRLLDTIQISWLKNGVELLDNNNRPEYKTSARDSSSSGNYTCIVSSSLAFLDPVEEHWTVVVKQAPTIDPTFPSRIALIKGQSMSTLCQSRGIPAPEVKWLYDQQQNTQNTPDQDQQLEDHQVEYNRNVIEPSETYDTSATIAIDRDGLYKCVASNVYGKSELAMKVTLVNATAPLDDFDPIKVQSVNAGSSLVFNCSAQVDPGLGPFGVETSWLKDGIALLSESGSSITIPYLIDREHSGNYTCLVKTSVDSISLSQVVRVITSPPKITKKASQETSIVVGQGENVTLKCSLSSGIPTPTIKWKFDSEILGHTEELNLSQVLSDKDGIYTCLAVNEYGSDSLKFNLSVILPPQITEGPEDIVMQTLGTVRFPCKYLLDPRINATIQWRFNTTQPVLPKENHQLVIDQVTKEDEGTYTCIVITPFESVNQTARLTVLGESPNFIATEKEVRALEGSRATLSCQANGMPLPEITWMKHNRTLELDDRISKSLLGDLQIEQMGISDQGMYQCVATNIYGAISTEVTVEVIKRSVPSEDQILAREVVKNVHDNVTLNCGISFDPRVSQVSLFNLQSYCFILVVLVQIAICISQSRCILLNLTIPSPT